MKRCPNGFHKKINKCVKVSPKKSPQKAKSPARNFRSPKPKVNPKLQLRPQNKPRVPIVAPAPKTAPNYAPLPPKNAPLQPVTNILKPIFQTVDKFAKPIEKAVQEILHPFKLFQYKREKEFVPPKLEKVTLVKYIVNLKAKQIVDNLIKHPISLKRGIADKQAITKLAGKELTDNSSNNDLLRVLQTAFNFYEKNYFNNVLYKENFI
jgi:hypothetical protein